MAVQTAQHLNMFNDGVKFQHSTFHKYLAQ